MIDAGDTALFEAARPALVGLAYRILGSHAEAEDAVQDTFLRWSAADRAAVANPRGWLTTVCTRRCLDLRKAADRSRVDYFGTWLPEPVRTASADEPPELADSVTTAFLLMLDRLTARERAAWLLRRVFGQDYAQVAAALDLKEPACRKLVSRAEAALRRGARRRTVLAARQEQLLDAFQRAVNSGRTDELESLLAEDVVLSADGGGKVPAAARPLHGRREVVRFVRYVLGRHWRDLRQVRTEINGMQGLVLEAEGGAVVASLTFACDGDGAVRGIYIMRNPAKFGGLAADPTL